MSNGLRVQIWGGRERQQGHLNFEVRRGEAGNPVCYLCRFDEAGLMRELTEYMDTALCERVVVPPVFAASA